MTSWRRRYAHPGIYLYRTRRHMRPGTEWGYGGKSRNLELRDRCHSGSCRRHPDCRDGKPWSDLIVARYTLELPWWLGFDWITLSLETMMIFIVRPRYNWQKNPRRSKVGPMVQRMQRRMRDASPQAQNRWQRWNPAFAVARASVLLALAGGGAWLWIR